jgi:plasmid stabilization system protein ParE
MPVTYTRTALRSLAANRAHIGQENPAAANRIAVQIVAACDRLEYVPERGRPGPRQGTREMVALWPYVVVYRVTPRPWKFSTSGMVRRIGLDPSSLPC